MYNQCMATHNVFDGAHVHVRARRCETCVFGNNSPVSVERREEMVALCGDQSVIPCHKHLYVGEPVNPVCRGFYETGNCVPLRIAEALDMIAWTK